MNKIYYIIFIIIILFFIVLLMSYHLTETNKSNIIKNLTHKNDIDVNLKDIFGKDLKRIMESQSFWLDIYYHRKFNTINMENSPDKSTLKQSYDYLTELNNMFVNFIFKECDKSEASILLKNKIYILDKIIFYVIHKNDIKFNKSLNNILIINKKLSKLISKSSFGKQKAVKYESILNEQIYDIILFLKNRKKLRFSEWNTKMVSKW